MRQRGFWWTMRHAPETDKPPNGWPPSHSIASCSTRTSSSIIDAVVLLVSTTTTTTTNTLIMSRRSRHRRLGLRLDVASSATLPFPSPFCKKLHTKQPRFRLYYRDALSRFVPTHTYIANTGVTPPPTRYIDSHLSRHPSSFVLLLLVLVSGREKKKEKKKAGLSRPGP